METERALSVGAAAMTHTELGLAGERFVALLLRRAGVPVERGGPADLLANGTAIEVKAARPSARAGGRRPGFQFCLRRDGRNGRAKTDVRKSVLTVLLCYPRDGDEPIAAFVVPSQQLGNRRKVTISAPNPRTYNGKWSVYLDSWGIMARILESEQ